MISIQMGFYEHEVNILTNGMQKQALPIKILHSDLVDKLF